MANMTMSAGQLRRRNTGGLCGQRKAIGPAGARKLALAALGVTVVAMVGLLPATGWAGGGVVSRPGETQAQRVEVVRPGEGLWSIAERAMPGNDIAAAVDELRRVNRLGAEPLQPGQVLLIPRP